GEDGLVGMARPFQGGNEVGVVVEATRKYVRFQGHTGARPRRQMRSGDGADSCGRRPEQHLQVALYSEARPRGTRQQIQHECTKWPTSRSCANIFGSFALYGRGLLRGLVRTVAAMPAPTVVQKHALNGVTALLFGL